MSASARTAARFAAAPHLRCWPRCAMPSSAYSETPAGATSRRPSATTPGAPVPHYSSLASRLSENRKTVPLAVPRLDDDLRAWYGDLRSGDPTSGVGRLCGTYRPQEEPPWL